MIKIDISNSILDLKLEINTKELIAIVGDSGSGKTTLLRVIAGLEEARGVIEVDGKFWLKNNRSLPPQKRSVGFVMQDYGLFENMSVLDNLLFVNRDLEFAKRLLKSVDMWELKSRYPNQLSGGQKQRVALTRAIIKKPKILLLDEPLSALHPKMRLSLQDEILKLHREFNLTTILVSHDLAEVQKMADRIANIKEGLIQDIKLVKKSNFKQGFLQGVIIDKKVDINKYELTININNSIVKIDVKEDIFNRYNIDDFIDIKVSF